jgi:hypothetical protein
MIRQRSFKITPGCSRNRRPPSRKPPSRGMNLLVDQGKPGSQLDPSCPKGTSAARPPRKRLAPQEGRRLRSCGAPRLSRKARNLPGKTLMPSMALALLTEGIRKASGGRREFRKRVRKASRPRMPGPRCLRRAKAPESARGKPRPHGLREDLPKDGDRTRIARLPWKGKAGLPRRPALTDNISRRSPPAYQSRPPCPRRQAVGASGPLFPERGAFQAPEPSAVLQANRPRGGPWHFKGSRKHGRGLEEALPMNIPYGRAEAPAGRLPRARRAAPPARSRLPAGAAPARSRRRHVSCRPQVPAAAPRAAQPLTFPCFCSFIAQ